MVNNRKMHVVVVVAAAAAWVAKQPRFGPSRRGGAAGR
jgi:hypothetical protein